ncbi:MAG: hypothetical protein ABIO44_03155 [Saprospiraceae bacterium]
MRQVLIISLLNIFLLNKSFTQTTIYVQANLNYATINPILSYEDHNQYLEVRKLFKRRFLPKLEMGIDYSPNGSNLCFNSGLAISYRGTIDYYNAIGYYKQTDVFLELPLCVSYKFFKGMLSTGLGLILQSRLGTNAVYQEEVHHPNGFGFRVLTNYNFYKKLSIGADYTLGNVDKYIFNIRYNNLQDVLSLNLKYSFWTIRKREVL